MVPLALDRPLDQHVAPGFIGRLNFFWLGETEDTFQAETRLYLAAITPELTLDHGPTPLSDRHTLRYDLLPNGDGSLWLVWSGGLLAEPGLYSQFVDALGRPQFPLSLVPDGDWPLLIRTNDSIMHLFWIRSSARQVLRARFVDGQAQGIHAVTDTLRLERGDRLTGFSAGVDNTYGYLFWNVTRASGIAETWFSPGLLDANSWSQPQRLGLDTASTEPFQTGFNAGAVQLARAGAEWTAWARPLSGQFSLLPVAVQHPDGLALVYFQGGAVVGYQTITPVSALLAPPSLATDRDRHLYLAWSEPTPFGYAELKLTTTRG
jgi:hypothetical protein